MESDNLKAFAAKVRRSWAASKPKRDAAAQRLRQSAEEFSVIVADSASAAAAFSAAACDGDGRRIVRRSPGSHWTSSPTSAMSTRSVFSAAMRRGGWRSAELPSTTSAAASRLVIRGRRCLIEL